MADEDSQIRAAPQRAETKYCSHDGKPITHATSFMCPFDHNIYCIEDCMRVIVDETGSRRICRKCYTEQYNLAAVVKRKSREIVIGGIGVFLVFYYVLTVILIKTGVIRWG